MTTGRREGQEAAADTAAQRELVAALEPEALAICTVSDDCVASADGHLPECPVEQRLREDFGF